MEEEPLLSPVTVFFISWWILYFVNLRGAFSDTCMWAGLRQSICAWIPVKGYAYGWERNWDVLSTLSAQDSGLFISSAQWPILASVLTETTGWPNWPNSLGLRNKQDWLVKEGITKHTFNEKRVTAMSQLEKEKQESKESKATVACGTERS